MDQKGHFNDEVIDTVLRNFYVDDCLKSVESVDKAISLLRAVREVLSSGGFQITKWISNNREVMSTVPVSEWASEARNLDLDQDSFAIERALGVQWNAESDTFEFHIDIKDKPLTRRGMLSIVSSVYDPLGFLAPVILRAKCLLQELCKLGLGWDEPLPGHLEDSWKQWLSEVRTLCEFQVPRCLQPQYFGQIEEAVLHHFADASDAGYGVATYLRSVNFKGDIHVSLVCGKARVTPIKLVTIPRLELTAATVAVRIDVMLKRELQVQITGSQFWTYSMSVLRYISNQTSRFHTFVANRLTVIHQGYSVYQWRKVPTKLNPADEASRRMIAIEFLANKRWTKGPSFLWQSEQEWPTMPVTESLQASCEDPEVRKTVVAMPSSVSPVSANRKESDTDNDSDTIAKLVNHYSSWYRVKRAVALLVRVRNALLARVRCKLDAVGQLPKARTLRTDLLTVQEMINAENVILASCQKKAFKEEMTCFKDGKRIMSRSTIRRLDPYMDNGLLRVGGRLNKACMPEDNKHPIILPKHSRESNLF